MPFGAFLPKGQPLGKLYWPQLGQLQQARCTLAAKPGQIRAFVTFLGQAITKVEIPGNCATIEGDRRAVENLLSQSYT